MSFEEYLKMFEEVGLVCLRRFCFAILLLLWGTTGAWAAGVITGTISADVQGDDVTLVFTVENVGDAATFVSAPYFLNLSQEPNQDAPDGWIELDLLAPGQSHDEIVEVNDLAPGIYYAWLVSDILQFSQGTCGVGCMIGPAMYMIDDPAQVDPNLSVSIFSVEVGSQLSFLADVTNNGTVTTNQTSYLDLYLDSDGMAPSGQSPDAFEIIPVLAPGQTQQIQFLVELPQPGQYQAFVNIDPYNEIPEEDENDNWKGPLAYEVLSNTQIGEAELEASALTLTAVASDQLKVECTVTNTGTGVSGVFHWAIFLNPDSPPYLGMEATAVVAQPSLDAGASVVLSRTLTVFPGNHEIWVWVDSEEVVAESNEEDNAVGPKYIAVGLSQGEADLVVASVSAEIGVGNSVSYEILVRNLGLDPSGAFDVDVVFDSDEAPTLEMTPFPDGLAVHDPEGLMPGGERTYHLFWEQAAEGSYNSWAIVDVTNIVEETDESNNTTGPITVEVEELEPGVDLAISLFRAQVEGNTILYEVFVENTGTVDASAFDVGIFYDRDSENAPQLGEEADNVFNVEGLAAGTEVTVGFVWEMVPDGAYESWAWIDLNNAVTELNESNNRAGPRLILVDSDAAACPEFTPIDSVCVCGAETVYSGYCCPDGWSALVCDSELLPDGWSGGDLGGADGWTLPSDVELHRSAHTLTETSGGCNLRGF